MTLLTVWFVAVLLCLVHFLAALPWLAALDRDLFGALARRPAAWGWALLGVLGAGAALAAFLLLVQAGERLENWGRLYGAALQAQLTADLIVGALALVLRYWRRGGAVALAAFREGVRQPLFWLFVGLGTLLLAVFLALPYFTFGDDYKMMKQVDHDVIMLVAAAFGVIAAGLSISEEIEGRTAVTLMSKPVSRRQFLLGKYVGILLAALALTGILAWFFQWSVYFKPLLDWYGAANDPLQAQFQPALTGLARSVAPEETAGSFVRGVALWFADGLACLPGLLIGFGQVMVLVAIAAALATRLPLPVTMLACLLLYFLGHLAPVLVQTAETLQMHYAAEHQGQASGALQLVQFIAQLVDTVVPALEYFNLGPAIVRDRPLPLGEYLIYVGAVLANALLYTAIALLFGLILFEDRDLA